MRKTCLLLIAAALLLLSACSDFFDLFDDSLTQTKAADASAVVKICQSTSYDVLAHDSLTEDEDGNLVSARFLLHGVYLTVEAEYLEEQDGIYYIVTLEPFDDSDRSSLSELLDTMTGLDDYSALIKAMNVEVEDEDLIDLTKKTAALFKAAFNMVDSLLDVASNLIDSEEDKEAYETAFAAILDGITALADSDTVYLSDVISIRLVSTFTTDLLADIEADVGDYEELEDYAGLVTDGLTLNSGLLINYCKILNSDESTANGITSGFVDLWDWAIDFITDEADL